jgi:Domain of unknown function (DUF4868)
MSFAYENIANVEFGVCRNSLNEGVSSLVPVDAGVQRLLREMVRNTRTALGTDTAGQRLERYEPSEQHDPQRKLALPLRSSLARTLRAFYDVPNRPVDAGAMAAPQEISAYVCVLHDQEGNKLLAIRRATQFKAILRARLIRLVDDSLQALPDNVFKLDTDFDVLVADDTVYINRAAAFELLAEIDEQVQAAAVENTAQLGQDLPFVDFGTLSEYVGDHKRAARVVAALRDRDDLSATSAINLKKECKRSGVRVQVIDGRITPEPGHELAFLQMLDRRRYAVSLVAGRWEQYEAASRKPAGVVQREGAPQAPTPGRVPRARR